jgi:Family of unknown function (DUF5362)
MSTMPPLPPASLVVSPLQRTQPWVRFLAVMGFIFAGLMVFVGVMAGIAGAATGRLETLALMAVYPIIGVLYIFPSLYLLRYADRIKAYLASGQEADLAGALDAQRSFWKFAGVYTVVSIVVGIAFAVIAAVVGVMFGMRGLPRP